MCLSDYTRPPKKALVGPKGENTDPNIQKFVNPKTEKARLKREEAAAAKAGKKDDVTISNS